LRCYYLPCRRAARPHYITGRGAILRCCAPTLDYDRALLFMASLHCGSRATLPGRCTMGPVICYNGGTRYTTPPRR
jgi:hypothetical protein